MNNRGQWELAFRLVAEKCHTSLVPWCGTETAAGPDAAVIQRPFCPGPWFQGRGGRPGCAERIGRRGPQRALGVRRRWFGGGGGGARRSRGGGRRTRKTNVLLGLGFSSVFRFGLRRRADRHRGIEVAAAPSKVCRLPQGQDEPMGRGVEVAAGRRVVCRGFAVRPKRIRTTWSVPVRSSSCLDGRRGLAGGLRSAASPGREGLR